LTAFTALKRHRIFTCLKSNELKRLSGLFFAHPVPQGETIFMRGQPGTSMFIVAAGTVKLQFGSVGNGALRAHMLPAGRIFGELALLGGTKRVATAVAVEDCLLLTIEHRDFQSFLQDVPEVGLKLIDVLGTELHVADIQCEEMASVPLPGRMARVLLDFANESVRSKWRIDLKQFELAEIVKGSRETVSKCLNFWARRGWVKLERGSIALLRPTDIALIAGYNQDDDRRSRPRLSYLHPLT
jgi:CRP-like cAMP-binding protein